MSTEDPTKNSQDYIENKELGLRYRESIVELTPEQQAETGLKRIRRREVSDLPACFGKMFPIPESEDPFETWENKAKKFSFDVDKCYECFHFLSEGRFPSSQTWSHILFGDGSWDWETVEQHRDKQGYFQPIEPFEKGQTHSDSRYLYKKSTDEWALNLSAQLSGKEAYSCHWLGGMPIYAFGNKNDRFVEYINQVLSNPEAVKMLEKLGWQLDKSNLQVLDAKDIERNREIISDLVEDRGTWKGEVDETLKNGEGADKLVIGDSSKDVGLLKLLLQGEKVSFAGGLAKWNHPFIPIVKNPDIKPLKWCGAELAVIPKQNSLEVLFFETE